LENLIIIQVRAFIAVSDFIPSNSNLIPDLVSKEKIRTGASREMRLETDQCEKVKNLDEVKVR
jgi:hypothetical protein